MERKRVVLSIRPVFASAILSGEKTIELRRVRPVWEPGTVAYVYATSPRKAIVGQFICGEIHSREIDSLWQTFGEESGLSEQDFRTYFVDVEVGHAIEVSSATAWSRELTLAEIADELGSFHPPRSYAEVPSTGPLATLLAFAEQSASA